MQIILFIGFWVCDKAGKLRVLKPGMPQLDPCCFPLLHPRGTLGFRWFMKKNGIRGGLTAEEKRMQDKLDDANQHEMRQLINDEPTVQDIEEPNNIDDDGNDLDEDVESSAEGGIMNEETPNIGEINVPPARDTSKDNAEDACVIMDDETQNIGAKNVPPARSTSEENEEDPQEQFDSEQVDIIAPNDNVVDPDSHTHGASKCSPKSSISERQFYRYRMAMRSNKKGTFHWLMYSIISIIFSVLFNYYFSLYLSIYRFARRLAEYFVISVLNRIERNEMDHLKAIQEKRNYRKILAREYIQAIENGLLRQGPNRRLGQVFLMPETFAGSRQYYQKKYADLMTIVRNIGNPTWYILY